jgi:2-aminobenzoate-CoA ligase
MIIRGGENISPAEVEAVLYSHSGVEEGAVIGQPDEERGMIVKAYCVLKPGHTGDEALVKALQEHVKTTLAPYKYPREIEFLDKLPRTETGKLQRFVLRQRASSRA